MVYGSVGHFGPGVEEVHPLDEVAHPEAQGLAGPVGILLQIEEEACHFCKFCQGETPWQEMPFFQQKTQ